MLAYVFPGQGAQFRGMGAELFASFKEYTQQADEILGYSVQQLCENDLNSQLNQTQFTQPALYTVNALTYLKHIQETSQKPDYVAGHSLGEYNALFAAGIFDFATGLKLVQKRGELMSQAHNGGMAAVMGLNSSTVAQILIDNRLSTTTIANYNSYKQCVISGPTADIEKAQTIFATIEGASFYPLSVSGAFHSPYMAKAREAFTLFLEPYEFATPKLPVIANVNAVPYHPLVIKSNLTQQITHPVDWIKTIEFLNNKPNITFQEIGPGTILTKLIQRITNKQ